MLSKDAVTKQPATAAEEAELQESVNLTIEATVTGSDSCDI